MSSTEEGRGEASNRIESDPDSAEDGSPQPQRSSLMEPVQSVGEVMKKLLCDKEFLQSKFHVEMFVKYILTDA